jgi:hypothetical protein
MRILHYEIVLDLSRTSVDRRFPGGLNHPSAPSGRICRRLVS